MLSVKLTTTQRLMLFTLGQYYIRLNQPLAKPMKLRTSKVTFITLLSEAKVFPKGARAIYKNLEVLEDKKCIVYDHSLIRFTEDGLKEIRKINKEVKQYLEVSKLLKGKPKGHLQTFMK
jgi:hypothetical protein